LPDFVDDDDAVAIERVLPALDTFDKGGHGRAFLDAGRAQIAGLPPGERYAEDVSSFFLPGVDKRGKRGAFAGARDADRDTEAAASGELRHHRALRLPLRGGGIDRRMVFKEGVGRALDQSGRQRGREISRCRFGEADEVTLLVGIQGGRHIPALLTAHGDTLGPEKRHVAAVLLDATLAKGFGDGVDVIIWPLADAGDDEGARRDLT